MKKIAILLAATMVFAINSNAQSMQSGYKGHVDAGYSVGIGDYDFGRFEVNYNTWLSSESLYLPWCWYRLAFYVILQNW